MITGKILKARGWPDGKVIGLAKAAGEHMERAGLERDAILTHLDAVLAKPGDYIADARLAPLAWEVIRRTAREPERIEPRQTPAAYRVWGAEGIEPAAVSQMEQALRLPVAVAGALMPDAHPGYGLPIGGVLAAHEAVIPYAVGVDIACRMRLSVYPVSPHLLGQRRNEFKRSLLTRARLGQREEWERGDLPEHPVLDDPAWDATRLLKSLKVKARFQLGTSGSGNHFVEWGVFRLYADDAGLGLAAGEYLALLSHSGSRSVGYKIATTFSDVAARERVGLDQSLRHLAWLSTASEAGQEYWLSMELAGRFAAANHEVIHRRVAHALNLRETSVIENHHNYAWRERLADGTEVITHRKGATPASSGTLGIIPGSMGDAGYVVRGRGAGDSLNSAAHGAGRRMSRHAALNRIAKADRDAYLRERGVTLLGGGIDEAPQAYKDIQSVIAAQDDLVEVIGVFNPRIVRMADEPGDY